jgi:hypothetical protein
MDSAITLLGGVLQHRKAAEVIDVQDSTINLLRSVYVTS